MYMVNYGKSAFPIIRSDGMGHMQPEDRGMSLRDYFAGQAINGFVATNNWLNDSDPLNIAKRAYCIADAMLEARGDV
jgi:hypothetical protein